MKRLAVLLPCLCLVSLAAAQPSQYLVVRVNVPSGLPAQTLPVLATADLADVQAVFGDKPPSGLITGIEQIGDTQRAVLGQMDVGSVVRIMLLLPSEPSGLRLIRLQPGAPPAAPGPPALKVTRTDTAITIANGSYEITHDPAKNGGLPSKIVFPQTGKVWDNFTFNDRIWQGSRGFRLGDDKAPQIELVASGPLYAAVQVRARYLAGQDAPPGDARAVYTYSYFAGSPVIRIAGDISQSESIDWHELHFFEMYFRDDAFTQWATNNEKLTPFKDDKSGRRSTQWGALVDGKNAVGLLASALIYDGKAEYGRYLHGPWVSWSDQTAHFAADVWIGVADDPVAAIAQVAGSSPRVLSGTVLTPKLVDALAALRKAGAKDPRLPWMAALIEQDMADGRLHLRQAEELAARFLTKGLGNADQKLTLGSPMRLLSTPELGMAFREDHGLELVSLYDLKRQRETLAGPCSLVGVALSKDKQAAALTNASFQNTATLKQTRQAMELQWEEPREADLKGLQVNLSLRLEGNLSYWTASVTNRTAGWSIERVTLPSLKIAALGDDAGDDLVLFPSGFGRAYTVNSGTVMGGLYPSGGAVMQWIGVCDGDSGVYVAQHDPTASTKTFYTTCGGDAGYSTLRIEVPAENASLPGNSYQTPGQVVIGVTGGGWWPMTRIYRQWLDKNAPWWPEPGKISRSDYPAWLQDTQTWSLTGGFSKDCVPQTKAFAEAMGTPTALHWYSWHVIPFDNQYPHYFPTKEGFRDGVKELQQAGVRVMPYINGRLWDKDTDDFRAEAYKYATKNPDGEPYIERYGSGRDLVPMCVSTPFWQDKIQEIVLKLVGEEGVDGVYIDQIGAAGAVLCYDKTHGHPLAGGHWWVDGYWKMLGPLQQKIAQVSPDKMLTTESNAEPYAKYLDAYLMCNDNSDYDVPLFPAVYAGKIQMFGTYMANEDWNDLTRMALRQGKLFAFGSQLWWSDPNVVKNPPAAKWLSDLAHLRQRVNEFFVHGQMAVPPVFAEKIGVLETDWAAWGPDKIKIHTPDLWATAWRVQDGRLMLALVNLPKEDRTFTLRFDPEAYGLKASAKVKIERVGAAGVTETVSKQGKFSLPVTLGPAEATALVITPQ